MPSFDAEIDQLYQLPLSDFTAARDALAKRAGPRGADIRRLQKPHLAAWAVNQTYWQRRPLFDRLVTASRRLRAAHAQQLSGKAADVVAAETAHRAALKLVANAAHDLLTLAGDSASPATMLAVTDTLQALLWTEIDGHLTRPMKPTGVEALAALKQGHVKGASQPAEVVTFKRPVSPTAETKAAQAQREADARRREIVEVERRLRTARVSDRDAGTALTRARKAAEAADRERLRLEAAVQQAAAQAEARRDALDKARKRADQAAAERTRLDDRLAWLRSSQ